MNTPFLSCVVMALSAAPSAAAAEAPAAFEFKDAAECDGRTMIHYRTIEFRNWPARPLEGDFKLSEESPKLLNQLSAALLPQQKDAKPGTARYGLIPVGPTPEAALAIVWLPSAPGGPEIWLDANGDGRLTKEERHKMSGGAIEIPISLAVQWQPTPKRVPRTLLLRRSAVNDGLRYAVRGYAAGTLELVGAKHAVLLADANADGLFDTVGQDRVWIDLNRDGRFDALTEQFPLGKAIVVTGKTYVISSDATASAVRARLRSGEEGKLRLDLGVKPAGKPGKLSVELVSDLGELAVIEKFGQAAAVPAGEYYVSMLTLELADASGHTWTYVFQNDKRQPFAVPAGRETAAAVLASLAMEVSVNRYGNPAIRPGDTVSVTPRLVADGGLQLMRCNIGEPDRAPTEGGAPTAGWSQPAEGSAEIVLRTVDGKQVDRGVTGFS
jgi:hypothetical protein